MAASTHATPSPSAPSAALDFEVEAADVLRVALSGSWRLADDRPGHGRVLEELQRRGAHQLHVDASRVTAWDSGLLTFLVGLQEACAAHSVELSPAGLPAGVQRLIELATAVPEKKDAARGEKRESLLTRIGEGSIAAWEGAREMITFTGASTLSLGRFLTGRAGYRRSDLMLVIQECGANALPIVSLISVLVGLILAFVGAIQLEQFGAEVYVADLVGIGMAREMGAMMTGVIMAGRTGAAFAAQLGTMMVNEEIDALRTLAVDPMDFLVLPRMLALVLMMPILTIYANLMGILGGGIIGVVLLEITPTVYWLQTVGAVGIDDFIAGLTKGAVFGVLVAIAGCMRGMSCGRSAQAVGVATTSAVVTGIVMIIVADSILTVVYNAVGL